MHKPTTTHWQALKHLLRYLKGTATLGLKLSSHTLLSLHAFGLGIVMTSSPLVHIMFTLVLTQSHGAQRNNNFWLDVPPKPSIAQLLKL